MDEYIEFYKIYNELLDSDNPEVGMESLKDIIIKASETTNKLVKTSLDIFMNVIEEIAANLIVISSNLRGYRIYNNSLKLMRVIVSTFDKMIEDCTMVTNTSEKLFRGLSKEDIANGVTMFTPSALTDQIQMRRRVIIDAAIGALDAYKQEMERSPKNPEDYASYEETVAIQKDMLKLAAKIRSLSKRTKLILADKIKLKNYNMDTIIDSLLNQNKESLVRMGAIIINSFGLMKVKPNSVPITQGYEKRNNINRNIHDILREANEKD